MRGCLKPTELIYWSVAYPSKAAYGPDVMAEHKDHNHVGYDGPLGPHLISSIASSWSALTIGSRRDD
jgi:hypothetical protein